MKKYNICNILINDTSSPAFDYSIKTYDEDNNEVVLISDSDFRNLLLIKYFTFNVLSPSYYDTVREEIVDLCSDLDSAIGMFKAIFTTWSADRVEGFYKLYQALRAKYDPISNYDKNSTITTTYSGTETNTNTPTGSEKETTDYKGTRKNETEFTGTETNTNTPTGTETTTHSKEGSEELSKVKGQHTDVDTTQRTTYDSADFYDTDKVSKDNATYTDTDTTSFEDRKDTDELTFTDRKTEDVKTFTNRKDTNTESFTNRSDEVTKTFTNRQTTDVKTFTNRKDEVSEHTSGNIGTTTSQMMIESQFPLTEKDSLANYIVASFVADNLMI